MKDEADVTAVTVHIAAVIRDRCDVRYSSTLKEQHFVWVMLEFPITLHCAVSLCWHIAALIITMILTTVQR